MFMTGILKFLGRGAGIIITGVMGIITFSSAITTVLYFTKAIDDMSFGRRLISILFGALVTFVFFKLTKLGIKLYKTCKNNDDKPVQEDNQNVNEQQTAPFYRLFSMWETSIAFCDGWYLLLDGKGQCSVISPEQARKHELDYVRYQASQDINRGGAPEEVAYASRGLKRVMGEDGKIYKWELTDGYCVDRIVGKPIEMKGMLTIPEQIGRQVINQVSDMAFYNCKELEKVILPPGVQKIGRAAFCGCTNLKEVVMPDGIISIGEQAFDNTQVLKGGKRDNISGHMLVSVNKTTKGEYRVPKSVTVIAEQAFNNCTLLEKIVVHDGVTNIGAGAFCGCSALKEIILPKTIKELGPGAFNSCSSLVNVTVPDGVKVLNHFEGCTSLKNVIIPETVTLISFNCFKNTGLTEEFNNSDKRMLEVGNWLISYKTGMRSELTVSDGIVGIADQNMMQHTHYVSGPQYKNIKSISLPDTLRYIGSDAFLNTGIEEIKLPEGLLTIGMNAFRDSSLKSITIPKSVKNIEKWAFMGCKSLECIIFEGNTVPTWPAIVGRNNGEVMRIIAKEGSPAHNYAKQYGEKYNLRFEDWMVE